jgi:hypothetical protein
MGKIRLSSILIGIWTMVFLCFRPSIFGEKYNILVFMIFSGITAVIFFTYPNKKMAVDRKAFYGYLLILVLVGYFFIQGIVMGAPPKTVFNSCFLIVVVSLLSLFVTSRFSSQVIKSFIYILFAISLSSVVTMLIFVLSGMKEGGLLVLADLTEFVGRTKNVGPAFFDRHYVYFPFSVGWASVEIGNIKIPRLLGIFREAGMAQIFFFTAYFFTYIVDIRRVKVVRAVLFIAGTLTFSTSALISFLTGYIVLKFYPTPGSRVSIKKMFVAVVVIPAIVLVVLFFPDVGLMDKVSSFSGNQRSQSFMYSWKKFQEKPVLGFGYYKGFEQMQTKKDYVQFLGLIGVAYQIGIIGLALYLCVWYYSLSKMNDRTTYFVLMPCFITLLISQPSYNDLIVWLLLLINFRVVMANEKPLLQMQSPAVANA